MSFKQTREFARPLYSEVVEYREYLASQQPIAEAEARFLDPVKDLIKISPEPVKSQVSFSKEEVRGFPPPLGSARARPHQTKNQSAAKPVPSENSLRDIVLGILIAVIVPILSFSVIPGFVGRMTVVLLVSIGVIFALFRSGALEALEESRRGFDGLFCLGAYGIVMAIIAQVLG